MPCYTHMVANIDCAGHRAAGSPAGPAVASPAAGQTITAAKINELRAAISTEVARWTWHPCYGSLYLGGLSTNVNVGTVIDDDSTVDVYDDGLAVVGSGGAPGSSAHPFSPNHTDAVTGLPGADISPALSNNTFFQGTNITVANFNTILNNYNQMRMDCICNSDCQCNQVCVCNVDCGCNYSDRNLKMEIIYC